MSITETVRRYIIWCRAINDFVKKMGRPKDQAVVYKIWQLDEEWWENLSDTNQGVAIEEYGELVEIWYVLTGEAK